VRLALKTMAQGMQVSWIHHNASQRAKLLPISRLANLKTCQSQDLPCQSRKVKSRTAEPAFKKNNFINNYFAGETPADRKIEIFHFGYGSWPLETSNA
jgi:hypothetical protein